jgi:hypothetical protein
MTYIKFEHVSGTALINLDQISKITISAAVITFVYLTASSAFTFSSAADALEVLVKIEKITNTINIDQLAIQG